MGMVGAVPRRTAPHPQEKNSAAPREEQRRPKKEQRRSKKEQRRPKKERRRPKKKNRVVSPWSLCGSPDVDESSVVEWIGLMAPNSTFASVYFFAAIASEVST
jgi:hypothetical protein